MNHLSQVKRISICAMCIALCYVLPIAFHSVGLGGALSPIHIPVLLCGIVCGGVPGLLCGLVGPVISSLLSGMPPMLSLARMVPELCAYGFAGGIIMTKIRTGRTAADVYISLVCAMIIGRVVGGIASAVFYTVTSGVYSIGLWLTSYFAESIPGIIVHLILVPVLYFALEKAHLIPARYSNAKV